MPLQEKWSFVLPDIFDFNQDISWLTPTLEKIKDHAKQRSQLNAPIDTGKFRESIDVEYAIEGRSISFYFNSAEPQTLKLHEATYQLGKTSTQQPSTKEGGVGNKFFTRVIDVWADEWADLIADAILNKLTGELK